MKNLTKKILSTIAATALGLASLTTAEAQTYAIVSNTSWVGFHETTAWSIGSLPFPDLLDLSKENDIIAVWNSTQGSSNRTKYAGGTGVNETVYLHGLEFRTMTTANLTHTISGSGGRTFSLGSAGITIAADSSNVNFATASFKLAKSQTWSIAAGRTLSFGGDASFVPLDTTTVLTLTGGGKVLNNGSTTPFGGTAAMLKLVFSGVTYEVSVTGSGAVNLPNANVEFSGENTLICTKNTSAQNVGHMVIGNSSGVNINFSNDSKIHLVPHSIGVTQGYIQFSAMATLTGDKVTFDNPTFNPLTPTLNRAQVVIGAAWGGGNRFQVKETIVDAGVDFYFANGGWASTANPVQLTVKKDGQYSLSSYATTGTAPNIVSAPTVASFSQTFASLSGGGVITTSLNAAATATDVATLTINSTNLPVELRTITTDFSGVLKDGINGVNSLSLIKNGPSTQILSGVNTYTGTTAANGGVLQVNGKLATSGVAIGSVGTFALKISGDNTLTNTGAFTLTNASGGTFLLIAGENLPATGSYTVSAGSTTSYTGSGATKAYGGTFSNNIFTLAAVEKLTIGAIEDKIVVANGRLETNDFGASGKAQITMSFNSVAPITINSITTKTSDTGFQAAVNTALADKPNFSLAYAFDTSTFGGSDSVMMSFYVGAVIGADNNPLRTEDFMVFYKGDGLTDEWAKATTQYSNLSYDGEYVSFIAKSFSSYGIAAAAIPEPSTYLLLGVSLVVIALLRRKKLS